MFTECAKTPLKSEIILLRIFILYEILILLVNWVICQMHVLVVFVNLRCVSFTSKSSKTFLKYIYFHWLIWSYKNVYSKIKFMSIDQKWIGNISTNNRCIINTNIIDIIYDINTLALRRIGWFYNPNIFLTIMLLKFLIMSIKITKFIWKDISIRYEVKVLLSKSLLHSYHIIAQSVFSRDFITWWEMIDLLVFI